MNDFKKNIPDGYKAVQWELVRRGNKFLDSNNDIHTADKDIDKYALIIERDIKIIDIEPYIGKCDFELYSTESGKRTITRTFDASQQGGYISGGWEFTRCRVRQNDIKHHLGDTQPVPSGLMLRLHQRDHNHDYYVSDNESSDVSWTTRQSFGYEVIGTAGGYQYEWEAKQ